MSNLARVASEGSRAAEITAAFTQLMSSFEHLANDCRDLGMDPMAMIMTILSGGAAEGGGAAKVAPTPSLSVLPAVLAFPDYTPNDTELARCSHDLIEAIDRGDVAILEALLAPGFVGFKGGLPTDRNAILATITRRKTDVPYIAQRTWSNECVVRKDEALVYIGKAHEVAGGNETHGGYLFDGWYLLQWVRAGNGWQVQLLTWQKESTNRDWWNDTFHTGRGFTHEPNRLLVEMIRGETPGVALELAMGQGRNALYLASQRWKVTGVDVSDEGLRIAREQAIERGLELETINADIDEWDFGEDRFDLVTMMYAGDHANWIDKIKASLRKGGLFVVEGWAKASPECRIGFNDGQLAKLFDGYEVLRDETVEDVPDWAWDKGKLVRFVARKKK